MFDLFAPRSNYLDKVTPAPAPCTSWYGHSFQKFDDTRIFCPTCGSYKIIKPAANTKQGD